MALCLTLQAGRFATTVTENDIVSLADRGMLTPGTTIAWNDIVSCWWQLQQTDTTVTPNDIVSCRRQSQPTDTTVTPNDMADRLPSGTVQHKMTQYWAGWQMTLYPSTKFTRQSVLGKILMCHISWHIQLPHIMLTHKDTLQHHTDAQGHLTLVHKHTPNTHPTQKLVLDGVLKESAS